MYKAVSRLSTQTGTSPAKTKTHNESISSISSAMSSLSTKQQTFAIGMIGCGQVGTKILNILLEKPDGIQIIVSRRQPDKLKHISEMKNLSVMFDNAYVVQNCNIMLLLIQPIHLKAVMEEIKPYLQTRSDKLPKLIIISCLALTDKKKLQQDLGNGCILEQLDIVMKVNRKRSKYQGI